MKMKYLFFIFIMSLTFVSCSDNDDSLDSNLSSEGNSSNIILRLDKGIFDANNNNRKNSISEGDPFTIKNVKREGEILQITLTYSGGCKEHTFEIIWDGIVYTDDPCKMNLLLIHRGDSDNCEALITETIHINLKNLIGDVSYKNDCAYHIFSTYNFSENPDVIIDAVN